MLNAADLYKQIEIISINGKDGHGDAVQIGTLITEYEVHSYYDVRNLGSCRSYHISCKQRVVIPNATPPDFSSPSNVFSGYPAIWQSTVALNPISKTDAYQLVDYTPKTLNAAITSSLNASTAQDTSTSGQYTTGSSTSVTNSYEVSANLGFSGMALTGGVSGSYGHSETDTREQSLSVGTSVGRNIDVGSSNTMSIKDWASYGFTDPPNQTPSWIWGQEYPWNVLEYYYTDSGQFILLPDFVQKRLVYSLPASSGAVVAGDPPPTKDYVVPPSNLSLYGINFLASARWVYPAAAPVSAAENITFTHSVIYWEGSHALDSSQNLDVSLAPVAVTLSGPSGVGGSGTYKSQPINLACLGLDPIAGDGLSNGAVVGFMPSQFYLAPGQNGFGITSGANNLLITGTGFDAPVNADTPMSAEVKSGSTASMTVQFKILSSDLELTLFLKHWKGTATGCLLSIAVNGNPAITRHVDSLEAGSGTDNVSKIILRNRDYTSADFYDYLVLGLNTITISVSPSADPAAADPSCQYVIRALAIN